MEHGKFIPTKGDGKGRWCAAVERKNGKLMYHFPVEASFVSFSIEFEITDRHLQVLQNDEERFFFLFAVMHASHQVLPHPTKEKRGEIMDKILFADKATVSKFLSYQNGPCEANGAISSFVRVFLDWEHNHPQPDAWFRN